MDLGEYLPRWAESERAIIKYCQIIKIFYVDYLRSTSKVSVVSCKIFTMLHVSGIIKLTFLLSYCTVSRIFFSRGYAKHRNDYLLGDRLCKYVTHSDVNFWPRTWRVWAWVSCSWKRPFWFLWFAFVKVFKAVRGMNLFLWWFIGHNSAAGEVKELLQVKVMKWHRVLILRFTRRGS